MKAATQNKLTRLRKKLAETKEKRDSLAKLMTDLQERISEEEIKEFRDVMAALDLSFDEALERIQTKIQEPLRDDEQSDTRSNYFVTNTEVNNELLVETMSEEETNHGSI
ncbi:hypothetical protein [Enterococcus sp. DIV1420a]|uniref:hypothetical protein n=1 Tax=Enterococcus sp. DIV1420a TaxID=2774672 RepID=UPI003F24BD26